MIIPNHSIIIFKSHKPSFEVLVNKFLKIISPATSKTDFQNINNKKNLNRKKLFYT